MQHDGSRSFGSAEEGRRSNRGHWNPEFRPNRYAVTPCSSSRLSRWLAHALPRLWDTSQDLVCPSAGVLYSIAQVSQAVTFVRMWGFIVCHVSGHNESTPNDREKFRCVPGVDSFYLPRVHAVADAPNEGLSQSCEDPLCAASLFTFHLHPVDTVVDSFSRESESTMVVTNGTSNGQTRCTN